MNLRYNVIVKWGDCMLIYEGTKYDFRKDMDLDLIPSLLKQNLFQEMHVHASQNEETSWRNSLHFMYKVLNDHEIPDNCGVAIEYNIPSTSKRVDFMVSGYDEIGQANAIIIELKQWSHVQSIFDRSDLVEPQVETALGRGMHLAVHPCYQAWSYARHMSDYIENIEMKQIKLHPCAYMHNYDLHQEQNIIDPVYTHYVKKSPLFTQGEIPKLRSFIKQYLKQGDDKEVLYQIEKGRIRPSKSLQNYISSMLDGNEEYIMIDHQKVVYEEIVHMAKASENDHKKRVMIAKGGSGTGKSVIAINAMVALLKEGMFPHYVTKNVAPRNVYMKRLAGKQDMTRIKSLFSGPDGFYKMQTDVMDIAIVDEAHRLREKSGFLQNEGENQIKEIINASRCSAFFIDPYQRVHLKDFGTIDEIKKQAKTIQAEIIEYTLTSQFRCGGSDGYISWVRNVLGMEETANFDMKDTIYDIQILDSPKQMYDMIKEKNTCGEISRLLAGYCWEWNSTGRKDSNYKDIKIDDFEISWNLDSNKPYAIDKGSIDQAGCIHTVQGLEFDYVGVIIGKDLCYEDGNLITNYRERAKSDYSVHGLKKLFEEDPEKAKEIEKEIILNTYYTLMTRGQKGCYIYCCDSALGAYLKSCL